MAHLRPNLLSRIVVSCHLDRTVILAEAGLSFLGARQRRTSWGLLIADAPYIATSCGDHHPPASCSGSRVVADHARSRYATSPKPRMSAVIGTSPRAAAPLLDVCISLFVLTDPATYVRSTV